MTNKTIFALLIILLTLVSNWTVPAQKRTAPFDFKGRYLVSVSDADMLASAYVDGKLGFREGADALSVVPLAGDYRNWKATEIGVSNSVAGPPASVCVSPDGRWAFVIETFASPAAAGKTFGDLPIGNLLTVVDLQNPAKPVVTESIKIGARPESIAVNPAGNLLAVTLHPPNEKPIALIPFANGKLGQPTYHQIPSLDRDERISHAEWHPSGEFMAGTLTHSNRVIFFKVKTNNGLTIESHGNPLYVGKYPFSAKFTPDGKHLVANALYWGDDVDGNYVEAPKGEINLIRVGVQPGTSGKVKHSLISTAKTGISPEGLTVSHDGRYVLTTNLERSYLPYDDRRITWYSSLSLFEIDEKTEQLVSLGDFPVDGILPEAAVFDAANNFVAAVVYDHFDDRKPGSAIKFWRLVRDPEVKLIELDQEIPVTRGAHSMVLVR